MFDPGTTRNWQRLVAATRQSPLIRRNISVKGGFEAREADGMLVAGRRRTGLDAVVLAAIIGLAAVLTWALSQQAPELIPQSLLLLAVAAVVVLAPHAKRFDVRPSEGILVVRWGVRPFARKLALPLDRVSVTTAMEDEVAGYRGWAVVLLKCEGLHSAVRLLRGMSAKGSEEVVQELERLFGVAIEPPAREHTLPDGTVVRIPQDLLPGWPEGETRIRFREDGGAEVHLKWSARLAFVFGPVLAIVYAAMASAWLTTKWEVLVGRWDVMVSTYGRLLVVLILIQCGLTALFLSLASIYVWYLSRTLPVLKRMGRKRIAFDGGRRAVLVEPPEQDASPAELPFDDIVLIQLCLADRREPDYKNKGHYRRLGQVNLVYGRDPVRRMYLLMVRKPDEATTIAQRLAGLLGCPVCRSGPEEAAPIGRGTTWGDGPKEGAG
jgi:hypothetical protein